MHPYKNYLVDFGLKYDHIASVATITDVIPPTIVITLSVKRSTLSIWKIWKESSIKAITDIIAIHILRCCNNSKSFIIRPPMKKYYNYNTYNYNI
jgi:hypothetical protein